MFFYLQDFLTKKSPQKVRLLTAPQDFSTLVILSVSTQNIRELPIQDFVPAGSLILSAAMGEAEEEPLHRQFFKEASAAGAAAVFVKFKDTDYHLSAESVACADALGLPVFELPWDYRFADIQQEVLNCIQSARTRFTTDLQSSLLRLYFDAKTLQDAVDLVSRMLEVPCCITLPDGTVLAKSADYTQPQESEFSLDISLNDVTMGCFRCQDAGSIPEALLPELSQTLCFPLSLWFHRQSVVNLTKASLKNDFVWDLATQNYVSYDEMIYNGSLFKFDLQRPYTCLLCKAVSGPGSQPDLSVWQRDVIRLNLHETKIISELKSQLHLSIMFYSHFPNYIFYLENPDKGDSHIRRFIEKAEQYFFSDLTDLHLCWGISESGLSSGNFSELYNHASLALHYAVHSKTGQRIYTYEDTRQARIISLLSEDATLKSEAFDLMGQLSSYGDSSNIQLFETLVTYIDNNFNVSKTAKKLYIHRQSLLYRLSKIEELTGMSLKSSSDLFLLSVYARIFSGY